MKKFVFYPIFVFFSVFLSGCFEKPVEKVTARHADGSKRTSIWQKSDGTIRKRNEWFSNGIKEFEVTYKNNVEHGKYTRWSVHGDVVGRGQYNKGVLDGPQEGFFTDRRRRSIQFYDRGSREGRWEEFYFEGGKKSEEYFDNDKPSKVSRKWHKNGNLAEESDCFENFEKGHFKKFAENGLLSEEYDCRFGIMHGELKSYYVGGSVKTIAHAENGVINGKVESYFANGKPMKTEFYKLGMRDSTWVTLNASGDTVSTMHFALGTGNAFELCENDTIHCADTTFVEGKITGIKRIDKAKDLRYEEMWENGAKVQQRAYYLTLPEASPTASKPNHQSKENAQPRTDSLATEAFYKNGKLNGYYRNWHRNGQLQDSLHYIEGERFGEQISFDREGNITKHTKENGKTGQVIFLMDPKQ